MNEHKKDTSNLKKVQRKVTIIFKEIKYFH